MADPQECPEPLVNVTRGGIIESVHRGSIVISDSSGKIIAAIGEPDSNAFLRSAAKPIQALPVIESGAAKKYGFNTEELAVMCGSLNGQNFQVAAVRSILNKISTDEAELDCGVHRPSHRPTANKMNQDGIKPSEVHNNCAGKHAAMLVLCAHYGWDTSGYVEPEHPVQKLILNRVAEETEVEVSRIGIGLDGCGVPVFSLPLKNLAMAYAKFAESVKAGSPAATAELIQACIAHPEMIAGDDRICTEVMRQGKGRFFAKTGAEGTYVLAFPEKGWGAAISVEDGSPRSINPIVVELLFQLDLLDDSALSELAEYHNPEVKNHRGQIVGNIEAGFKILNENIQ